MKKITVYLIITFVTFSTFSQTTKKRAFTDVPYPNDIKTIEFTVLDINFDKQLVAFKHVFNLQTVYDEDGNIYQEPCNCNYTGMQNNPLAGVVLGVYDLSNQQYLKTFIIYNPAYEKSDCYDYSSSSKNLDAAKKFFSENNLDITKKPTPLYFSDDKLTIEGITFTYDNAMNTDDETMGEMITISKLYGFYKNKKVLFTVYQDDYYIMASGGKTYYKAAYKEGDKIVFLSRFDYFSHLAGETDKQTYQFSPIFNLQDLKKYLQQPLKE